MDATRSAINPASAAYEAARLVGFALRPRMAAGSDPDYARLFHEYRVDHAFQAVVEAVVDGLGLITLGTTEAGLVVAPARAPSAAQATPFAFRLVDLQRGMPVNRRLLVGLVHLGIAAAAYPREGDLESDRVVRRSAAQVEALLAGASNRLAADEPEDPTGDEAGEAWRVYKATPEVRRKRNGGFTVDCRMGIIVDTFEWLAEQGMARVTKTEGTFQLLDR